MLTTFQIVILCVLSAYFGGCIVMLIKSVIELYLIHKDIEEIQDKLEQNRKEREQIEENIKRLEKEINEAE